MELKDLQKLQDEHDRIFHKDVMGWNRQKQIEHCSLHLAKLAGLFGSYCEKMHHAEAYDVDQLISDRVPDLLIFALKFATLYNKDLEKLYLQRIRTIEERRKL